LNAGDLSLYHKEKKETPKSASTGGDRVLHDPKQAMKKKFEQQEIRRREFFKESTNTNPPEQKKKKNV